MDIQELLVFCYENEIRFDVLPDSPLQAPGIRIELSKLYKNRTIKKIAYIFTNIGIADKQFVNIELDKVIKKLLK